MCCRLCFLCVVAMLFFMYRESSPWVPISWRYLPQASHYPVGDAFPQDIVMLLMWLTDGSAHTNDLIDLGGVELSKRGESSVLITHAYGGLYLFGLAIRSKAVAIADMSHGNFLDEFAKIEYEDHIQPNVGANHDALLDALSNLEFLLRVNDSCGGIMLEKTIKGSEFKDKNGNFDTLPGENEYPYAVELFLPTIKESLWMLHSNCIYRVDIEILSPTKNLPSGVQANFIAGLPGWYQLSLKSLVHHLRYERN